MTQYCWFSIIFLSDMSEDAYHFICKKYSYARCKLMNRLLSFKNWFGYGWYTSSTLGWKCLIYRIIFFLMNTFRSHNKLFLYIINRKTKGRPRHFIAYYTTQREPTQRERVFGTKPPSAKTWSTRNHPD